MNKLDFKFLIWLIIAGLSVYSAFLCSSLGGFALFSVIAMLCVFVLALAGSPLVCAGLYIAVLLPAYLSAGISGAVLATAIYLLAGTVMAWVIKLSKDFATTLCSGSFVMCVGVVVVDRLVVTPKVGGLRVLYASVIDSVVQSVSETVRMISTAEPEATEAVEALMQSSAYAMKLLFPATVAVFSLAMCLVTLLFSRRFIANIPVPVFSGLKAPRAIAYVYCIGYFLSGVMVPSLGLIVTNVVMVLSAVMFICGLSFLRSVTRVIPSRFLSVIVYVFALPVCCSFPFVLTAAGTFDAVFDFRRFLNEKK